MMRSRDLGFRLGTGVFGLVLILIVVAIGIELTRQSLLSIQKFGLNFWRTQTWDPVAGNFGALPFIWGTLYSSTLALTLATPVALGIAGIFVMVPAVRWLETVTPSALRGLPLFSGPPLGVGMLAAGLILAVMVIPFTSSVAREVLKT